MNTEFTQPKNVTAVEMNKQSIARVFGLKRSQVAYLKASLTVDDTVEILFDRTTQTCWYVGDATGSVTSWSITDAVCTLVTSTGTFTLDEALVFTKQQLANNGADWINTHLAGSPSIYQTLTNKLSEILSVKDYGAKGDGTTDDTAAIQSLLNKALERYKSTGQRVGVWVPPGEYRVSKITLYAHSYFFGSGRCTVLKRLDGYVGDVIYGVNSDNLWSYTGVDASDFAYNFDFHDMVIDGNTDGVINKFSKANTGHGVAIWGSRYRMYNIDILNCAEKGMRTGYKDQNLDYLAPWFESTIYSLRINNCGKEGWDCNGPHDAAIHDIGIINGSRLGNGLYDGVVFGTQMSGNIGNMHVSNGEDLMGTGYQVRHRYAANIEGPCRFYGGTTFEGSINCVRIASSGVQFDESCTHYIPWGDGYNGVVMVIEPGVAFCRIRGRLSGAGSFKTQTNWGIQFKTGSGTISHNDIDVTIDACQIPISFGDSTTAPDADGGKNRIKILAYYGDSAGTSAPNTYGVPNTANNTSIDILLSGNANSVLRSEVQNTQLTIAAGASAVWTYKYPFNNSPALAFGLVNPGGVPTGSVWCAGRSATQATFYNGSGQSITLDVTATRLSQQ